MNAAEFSIGDIPTFKRKAFYRASRHKQACFLDSNEYSSPWSSFDCLAASGTRHQLRPEKNCFEALKTFLDDYPGWKLGYLGYDLKNETEELESAHPDPLGLPSLFFFIPEELLILKGNKVRILSEADPSTIFEEVMDSALPYENPTPFPEIHQGVSRENYLEQVAAIRQHIKEGDIYELNYCIDFFARNYLVEPEQLFMRLNSLSPAPFASFLKNDAHYILSGSPERFLKKTGERIISQPIKGTIRRSTAPSEDEDLKAQLSASEKERAENVMIVDLVRNDLSRSALPGSVKVSELFGIHSFRYWHQMISTVEAIQRPDIHPVDIIRNAFPMGSMTGAPKVKAMQLIDRYERVQRGAFSGAIGYFTPEGDFDFNVVIRSILYNRENRYLSFPVGSAITYDSVAQNEYEECLLKAKAIRQLFAAKSS